MCFYVVCCFSSAFDIVSLECSAFWFFGCVHFQKEATMEVLSDTGADSKQKAALQDWGMKVTRVKEETT